MITTKDPATEKSTTRLIAAVFLCSLLLGLAACGQRGPLYLPDEETPGGATQEESPGPDEDDDEETSGT